MYRSSIYNYIFEKQRKRIEKREAFILDLLNRNGIGEVNEKDLVLVQRTCDKGECFEEIKYKGKILGGYFLDPD